MSSSTPHLMTPFQPAQPQHRLPFDCSAAEAPVRMGSGLCVCGARVIDPEDTFCSVSCARRAALSSLCANQPSSSFASHPTHHSSGPSYPTYPPPSISRPDATRMHEAFQTVSNGRYSLSIPRGGGTGWDDPFLDAPSPEEEVPYDPFSTLPLAPQIVNHPNRYAGQSSSTHTRNPSTASSMASSSYYNPNANHSRPPSLASSISTSASTSLSRNGSTASNVSAVSARSANGRIRRYAPGMVDGAIYESEEEENGGVGGVGNGSDGSGGYGPTGLDSSFGTYGFPAATHPRSDGKGRGLGLMQPAQLFGEMGVGVGGKKDASTGPLRVAKHGNISTGPGYEHRKTGSTGRTTAHLRTKKSATSVNDVNRSRSARSRAGHAHTRSRTRAVPATPFSGMNADLKDVLEEIISMEQGFRIDSSEGEEHMMDIGDEEEISSLRSGSGSGRRRDDRTGRSPPKRKTSLQSLVAQMAPSRACPTTGNRTESTSFGPPSTPLLALEAGRRLSLVAPFAPLRAGSHSRSNSASVQPILPGGSPPFPDALAQARPRSSTYGHNPSRSESHTSLLAAIEGPGPLPTAYEHIRRVSEVSIRPRPESGMFANAEYSPGSAYMVRPEGNSHAIRRSLSFAVDSATSELPAFAFTGAGEEVEANGGFGAMDCSTPSAQDSGGRFFTLLSGSGGRRMIRQPTSSPSKGSRPQGSERDSIRRFQFPLTASTSGSAQVTPVKARPNLLIVPSLARADRSPEDVVTPTGIFPAGFRTAEEIHPTSALRHDGPEIPSRPYTQAGFIQDITPSLPIPHARLASTSSRAPTSGVRLGVLLGSGNGSAGRAMNMDVAHGFDFDMSDESGEEGCSGIEPLRWTRGQL